MQRMSANSWNLARESGRGMRARGPAHTHALKVMPLWQARSWAAIPADLDPNHEGIACHHRLTDWSGRTWREQNWHISI